MKRSITVILRRWGLISSLTVSGLLAAMWIRSYAVGDRYRWVQVNDGGSTFRFAARTLVTGSGGITFQAESIETDNPDRAARVRQSLTFSGQLYDRGYRSLQDPRYPIRYNPDDSLMSSLGIYYRRFTRADGRLRQGFMITLPFWGLLLATGAYPMMSYVAGVLRRQREDRMALGLCPRCGVPIRDPHQRCPGCDLPATGLQGVQV